MMDWARKSYLAVRRRLLEKFYPPAVEGFAPESIGSILVLRCDRIGDMVQTTPLLAALRAEFPEAKVSVLASEENEAVLRGNPNVDRIWVLPKKNQAPFFRRLNGRGFDLLIDAYLSYDWAWSRMSSRIAARYRLGLDLHGRGLFHNIRVPAPLPPGSAAETILEICRRGLKRPFLGSAPQIYLQEGESDRAWTVIRSAGISLSRPVVLLHPGGYYPEQRWPVERFAETALWLSSEGLCSAALVGGPKDEPLLGRASSLCRGIKTVYTHSLRELIAALSCARLLICNNSGPLHAACALGVPTLSTLGPSDPVLWAPQGESHRVLRRQSLRDLATAEVVREAVAMLKPGNSVPQVP